MRLRQLTGELRGKDMEVGRLLEDKMRILGEILEEQGIQPPPLPPLRYTLLVQERDKSLTKEELLQVGAEPSRGITVPTSSSDRSRATVHNFR